VKYLNTVGKPDRDPFNCPMTALYRV